MKIVHPELNDISALKSMWKDIFGDTEEYIELFFSRVVALENILVVKNNENVLAMVFYPEYICKLGGRQTKCGYICGAATLPQFRGQGIMGKLLREAVEDMKNKGYGACVLIPAGKSLFEYYGRFGFEKNIQYRKADIFEFSLGNAGLITVAENVDDIWEIYCNATADIDDIVLQSKESYRAVMEEYEGNVYVYDNKCFIFANKDTVDEIFSADNDIIPEAIGALQCFIGQKINGIRCYWGYLKGYGEPVYNGMFLNLQNFAPSQNIYLKMVLE